MVSFFRVLRYYPDAVTGERINVGVIAFNDEQVVTRVRRGWDRVASFGGNLSQQVAEDYLAGLQAKPAGSLRDYEAHYMSCMELSEPCVSIETVSELADDMAKRMLGN